LVHLELLCSIDAHYTEGHFPKPYGNDNGFGWGLGEGTVSGQRLSGTFKWSNHKITRSDGVASPTVRGVITTGDGHKVLVELTGRTVFVSQGDEQVGNQLLMTLFESDAHRYAWLNNEVCFSEGRISPAEGAPFHLEVYLCKNDLL
jgi:hypothetical protein